MRDKLAKRTVSNNKKVRIKKLKARYLFEKRLLLFRKEDAPTDMAHPLVLSFIYFEKHIHRNQFL